MWKVTTDNVEETQGKIKDYYRNFMPLSWKT